MPDGGFRHVKATTLNELPQEPFTIEQATFEGERADAFGDQLLHGLRWVATSELIVRSAALTDQGLAQLIDPPPALSIQGHKLTDVGLVHLSRFDRTELIALSDLRNVTGTGLRKLNPSLRTLSLARCPITPEGIAAIGSNTQLKALSFLEVMLTPQHLQQFHNYRCEHLDFNVCGLDDETLRHLPALETLTKITIQNSMVSGQGLAELKRMKNLKVLTVDGNSRVTKEQVNQLAQELPSVKLEINVASTPERVPPSER
ncbi:MAG: hypothetical protein NT013_24090 [Planctomycetia bacterium]|nr:hypothetical protein [Planctomycetia bacterium]